MFERQDFNDFNYLENKRTPESFRVPIPAAAVAIVNHEGKVLLMKRVDYGSGHGNDWVYPGGAVDSSESFEEAARREVTEETGLILDEKRNRLFPLANYITAPDAFGTRHDLMIYVTQYGADQPEPRLASTQEMTEWGWFDPQTVIEEAKQGKINILPSGIFAIQRLKEYLSGEKTRTYGEVLMGGTFDRLHAGHKRLLQQAFEVGDYVYIGLTTDEFIERSKKQLKEDVASYSKRLFFLRKYLYKQGVLNRAIILPLSDIAGPKALDPKLEAIVVSEETVQGGEYVNSLRLQNNVPPMEIVVVPLLADLTGQVISSTRLRQQEVEQPLIPDLVIEKIHSNSPAEVIRLAKYISQLMREEKVNPTDVLENSFDSLEQLTDFDGQVKTLLFLACLEDKYFLWEETPKFLDQLKENHNFTGVFSLPFQRFINYRLGILRRPEVRKGFEDIEITKQLLDLLQQNSDFFYDLLELQTFFTQNVSPVMPLNATWNPELTQCFGLKNVAGLQYIYENGLGAEYLELMQKHLSPEWTGFNRFAQEPWEALKDRIDKQGNLVDIGSSVGIGALEIAQALDIDGQIILLDCRDPYSNTTSLRIIDYADPQRGFIPLNEVLARMEMLRSGRTILSLFGVDMGETLTDDIQKYIQNAALVHMGNVLPYIPGEKFYHIIANALWATSESGGILKIHNDESLPTDSLLTSLTLQRDRNHVMILRELVKSRL